MLIGILAIVFIAVAFYFFIQKDNQVQEENIVPTPLTKEQRDALIFQELNSIAPPLLNVTNAEVEKSLDAVKPKRELTPEEHEAIRLELENLQSE